MEVSKRCERPKSNKEESLTLMALTVVGDYFLDSCSERDFDDHECNELFLVVIDGWAGRSELIASTTFSCSLTEHVHTGKVGRK